MINEMSSLYPWWFYKKRRHFIGGYLIKEQTSSFTYLFIWMIPMHNPALQYEWSCDATVLMDWMDPTSIARLTPESANI